MNKLMSFFKNNLSINWQTILIGWDGPGKYSHQLTLKEIIEYAIDLISKGEQSETILMLASTSDNDYSEVDNLLRILANTENVNQDWELRKWRLILAQEMLMNLNKDPLYGLIQLTEFWEKFGYPNDSPHIVQGLNNEITPESYYSDENYAKIIDNHNKWLETELKMLKET